MTSVELFGMITEILVECANVVSSAIPEGIEVEGPVLSKSAKSYVKGMLNEKETTIQVKAFEDIEDKLSSAKKVAEELAVRAPDGGYFTSQGIKKLNKDVNDVNSAGADIKNAAKYALKKLKVGSPGAKLINMQLNISKYIYKNLQEFINDAGLEDVLPDIFDKWDK